MSKVILLFIEAHKEQRLRASWKKIRFGFVKNEIAKLYGKDRMAITRHINKFFSNKGS